jgi:hypothetical protein
MLIIFIVAMILWSCTPICMSRLIKLYNLNMGKLGMVVHAYNPSTQEAEVRES